MKKELIKIIKVVGIYFNEIFTKIDTGNGVIYDSIEYRTPNDIILHIFTEDMDIESNWDDLTMSQKKRVFRIIRPMLYN